VPSPPQNSGIDAENDYQLLRGCFYECECTKGKDKRDENYSRGARGAIHERGQQTNNKRVINHTGEMAIMNINSRRREQNLTNHVTNDQ
jgi:hypothetical protein